MKKRLPEILLLIVMIATTVVLIATIVRQCEMSRELEEMNRQLDRWGAPK